MPIPLPRMRPRCTGRGSAGTHGSAPTTSGQGGFPVRFVDCPARKVDGGTLTKSGSEQGQEQLCIEEHACSDPSCTVPRRGGWTRGLKDIKAAMGKDGENFWVGNNKDRKIKLKLVRA